MTHLLEEVISKIRDLRPTEQDALAALILAELEDEARWDRAFGRSQERPGELAQEVREPPHGPQCARGRPGARRAESAAAGQDRRGGHTGDDWRDGQAGADGCRPDADAVRGTSYDDTGRHRPQDRWQRGPYR